MNVCARQENLIGTLLAIFGNLLVSIAVSIQVSMHIHQKMSCHLNAKHEPQNGLLPDNSVFSSTV